MSYEPGDILAFCGRGITSKVIQTATCSAISHVGCVAHVTREQLLNMLRAGSLYLTRKRISQILEWQDQHLLFESTTLATEPCEITGLPINGVQAHRPDWRVADYAGKVWRYRLTPAWRETFLDTGGPLRLAGKLIAEIGKQYDGRGAILSGSRVVKHWWAWQRVDRSSLFCSEYLVGVLQHVGLFPLTNPSKITPAGLIRTMVAADIFQKPILLKG